MGGGGSWRAVVPLRAFAQGKTRLRSFGHDPAVTELARLLALRTIAVLESVPEISSVLVVTDETGESFAASTKTSVLRESRPAGLNTAVERGLLELGYGARRASADPVRILVLHADLPLVERGEVSDALLAVEELAADAFVADESGAGTTALAFFGGAFRAPRFGPGSALLHRLHGFASLDLPREHGMRRDLDTWEQVSTYLRSPQQAAVGELLARAERSALAHETRSEASPAHLELSSRS